MVTNKDIKTRLQQCQQKLEQLKQQYDNSPRKRQYIRDETINGLRTAIPYHPYALNPPLGESAVRKLEKKYGIHVPTFYRSFLLQVGDGGGGFFNPLQRALLRGGEVSKKDIIVLREEWPMITYLVITGSQMGSVYIDDTDGDEKPKRLHTSFIGWFNNRLQAKEKELTAFLKEEADVSTPIAECRHYLNNVTYYEGAARRGIMHRIETLVTHTLFTPEEYVSLIDSTLLSHFYDLTVLIGEKALPGITEGTLSFTESQLMKLLRFTGLGYANLKDEKGITLLERSIALSGDPFHYGNIAKLFLDLNRLPEAKAAIDKAPEGFYNLSIKALVYKALKDTTTAKQFFKKSISQYNGYSKSYEGLADLYMEEGAYKKAATHYKKANQCMGADVSVLYKLASLYVLANNTRKAIKVLENIRLMQELDIHRIENDPVFSQVIAADAYQKWKRSWNLI